MHQHTATIDPAHEESFVIDPVKTGVGILAQAA